MTNVLFPAGLSSIRSCFFQKRFFLLHRSLLWLYRLCFRYMPRTQTQGFDSLKSQNLKHIRILQTKTRITHPKKFHVSLKSPFREKKTTDNHLRFFALGFILRLRRTQNNSWGGTVADVNVRESGSAFEQRRNIFSPSIQNYIIFRQKRNRFASEFSYENLCHVLPNIDFLRLHFQPAQLASPLWELGLR